MAVLEQISRPTAKGYSQDYAQVCHDALTTASQADLQEIAENETENYVEDDEDKSDNDDKDEDDGNDEV